MTNSWTNEIDWETDPLYREIARALESGIEAGQLLPGDSLPTHRKLAGDLGVAIGTITKAYALLEQKRLIFGKGRRGTIVGTAKDGQASLAALLNRTSGKIDLSINYPNTVSLKEMTSVFNSMAEKADIGSVFQYQHPRGSTGHRQSASRWMQKMGLETDADSIILTAGAQHALNVLFPSILEPGDIVLSDHLTYPGIKAVADLHRFQILGVPMDREGMIPDALESICRQRNPKALYCIPTLQNPTSIILSEKRRESIADIAEKYNIHVIEDDIHRGFVENPPAFIASKIPDRTFVIQSVSKLIAGGLRIGFIHAPSRWLPRLIQAIQATLWNVSPISLEIFDILQKEGITERIIRQKRKDALKRYTLAQHYFSDLNPTLHPQSTFFWLPLPEGWTQTQLCIEAERKGVMVSPAETFAINEKDAPHAVRICHGTPPTLPQLELGFQRLRIVLDQRPSGCASIL